MPYQAHPPEVERILFDVLKADQRWQRLPPFVDIDAALGRQVLQGAATFVDTRIAPINRSGDETGAQWSARQSGEGGEGGDVTLPAGFKESYQAFWQEGWASLSTAPEWGGQGLPSVLDAILYEWLAAANHGWTMAPGLLHGAYECLKHYGDQTLCERYLQKIATGEWLATMCLSEAHAGSDLGLIRTRAVPGAHGSFALTGEKIFISGGDHDLSANIVHLVLARLPDAPPGVKGLSLFLAPKFLPEGPRNPVWCDRIENKMGLHASPTCVMRFDQAQGWLVGEPHRGLSAMFVMMNAARLHVALQGIGLLDAAHQTAHAYAQERRQMRAPGPRHESGATADVILRHPAIQRQLDTQQAWVQGGRLLAYETALCLDEAQHASDPALRRQAQRWCSLTTPILKATCTDQGFVGASACLQVLGGHGYLREWGLEQIVRDARITLIYEGTNEIQAIDLLMRKVLPDAGAELLELTQSLQAQLAPSDLTTPMQALIGDWQNLVRQVVRHAHQDQEGVWAHAVAGDFLRLCALGLWSWALTRLACSDSPSATQWLGLHQTWWQWVLPDWQRCRALLKPQTSSLEPVTDLN